MDATAPDTNIAGLQVRRWYIFIEDVDGTEFDQPADGPGLRKVGIAAAVVNPYKGEHSDDLSKLIEPSVALGKEFGRRLLAVCGHEPIESYGKGCVIGFGGEYEHGNALLTSRFADPVRDAIGGGKSWIPSTGKIGGPGTVIDLPFAHKDALYVRSHYDTFSLHFGDGPRSDEILAIFVAASRGRLYPRVGGLTVDEVVGDDGLH